MRSWLIPVILLLTSVLLRVVLTVLGWGTQLTARVELATPANGLSPLRECVALDLIAASAYASSACHAPPLVISAARTLLRQRGHLPCHGGHAHARMGEPAAAWTAHADDVSSVTTAWDPHADLVYAGAAADVPLLLSAVFVAADIIAGLLLRNVAAHSARDGMLLSPGTELEWQQSISALPALSWLGVRQWQ